MAAARVPASSGGGGVRDPVFCFVSPWLFSSFVPLFSVSLLRGWRFFPDFFFIL